MIKFPSLKWGQKMETLSEMVKKNHFPNSANSIIMECLVYSEVVNMEMNCGRSTTQISESK